MIFKDKYKVNIGLEIHAQLNSKSKCFSSASTEFGKGHNNHVTLICAGFPGTLPVLNAEAVRLAIKTASALNCNIQKTSIFSRKQYFYPDMPKGYQITQFEYPIALNGYVDFYLEEEKVRVELERAHMEEDAGKSTHYGEYSLINLNRAGTPLLEIVSKPIMTSPQMAAGFAKTVRQVLRYAEVCDGNLEQGSMRCDCNVSIRLKDEEKLGTKVELKNINSFRFIEKAIEYEVQRQIQCLENGEEIFQETRLYDSVKNKTISMRKKEAANDYRYFPEPDLMPLQLEEEFINRIVSELSEGPIVRVERFVQDFQLSLEEALLLTSERELSDFFEQTILKINEPKMVSNWLTGEVTRLYNESSLEDWSKIPFSADTFSNLLNMINNNEISGKIGKEVLEEMWKTSKTPQEIVQEKGLSLLSDENKLQSIIESILNSHQDKVEEYRNGKVKLYGFFVGQVMKETQGQASPPIVNKILKEKLK